MTNTIPTTFNERKVSHTIIGGMQYQKSQTEQVKSEAATIVKNVKVEVSKQ